MKKNASMAIILSILLIQNQIITSEVCYASDTSTAEPSLLMAEYWDEAEAILKSLDEKVEMIQLTNGTYYGREVFELRDGSQFILEFEDRSEEQSPITQEDLHAMMLPQSSSGEMVWEDYGSRCFTATQTILTNRKSVSLILDNHYELSRNGIEEKYGAARFGGTNSAIGRYNGPYILIKTATSIGGYTSMSCEYEVPSSLSGSTRHYKLTSYIDYMAHNASTKQIQVKHRWSVS